MMLTGEQLRGEFAMSTVSENKLDELSKRVNAFDIKESENRIQLKRQNMCSKDFARDFPPCIVKLWRQLSPAQQELYRLRWQLGDVTKRQVLAVEAQRRNLKYTRDSSADWMSNFLREGDDRLFELIGCSEWFEEVLEITERPPGFLTDRAQRAVTLYSQAKLQLGPYPVGAYPERRRWQKKAGKRLRDAVYLSYCGNIRPKFNRRLKAIGEFGWDLAASDSDIQGAR